MTEGWGNVRFRRFSPTVQVNDAQAAVSLGALGLGLLYLCTGFGKSMLYRYKQPARSREALTYPFTRVQV